MNINWIFVNCASDESNDLKIFLHAARSNLSINTAFEVLRRNMEEKLTSHELNSINSVHAMKSSMSVQSSKPCVLYST